VEILFAVIIVVSKVRAILANAAIRAVAIIKKVMGELPLARTSY
jgi:hypothetical protein